MKRSRFVQNTEAQLSFCSSPNRHSSAPESFSKISNSSNGGSYIFCKHEDALSDVAFCQNSTDSSNFVISCSFDGTVYLWDSRVVQSSPIQTLKVPPPANCVAWKENSVACGFQESGGLFWWDLRNLGEPLNLEESHAEAVTQLLFTEDEKLFSCGEDGYICSLYTQNLPDEDEALDYVINIGSAIYRFGLYESMNPNLWSITRTQEVYCFDLDTLDTTSKNQRESLLHAGNKVEGLGNIDYFVSCFYDALEGKLFIGGGLDNGDLLLLTQYEEANTLVPFVSLNKGHQDVVRDFVWNTASQTITSVGEDGKVCIWKINLGKR
ncbi:WD repeat-containing protein 89 [Galdieria sulphuraria]|nr:WD repeat-containing protein 89 [Galdieria sulphuraria]